MGGCIWQDFVSTSWAFVFAAQPRPARASSSPEPNADALAWGPLEPPVRPSQPLEPLARAGAPEYNTLPALTKNGTRMWWMVGGGGALLLS